MRRPDHSFVGVLSCVCVYVCLKVCELETSTKRWPVPDAGCCTSEKKLVALTF